MAHRSFLSETVDRYLSTVVARESPLQKRLRAETSALPEAGMQIGADQGVLLAFLVRLIGARRAIEIGTFTGYSALAVASALPTDGRLVCCDISDEWTSIAHRTEELGYSALHLADHYIGTGAQCFFLLYKCIAITTAVNSYRTNRSKV